MRSGAHGARLAVLGGVGGCHSFFPFSSCMCLGNTSEWHLDHLFGTLLFPLPIHASCFTSCRSTQLSPGNGAPFWAACLTSGLGTLGWLLCCLCRLDTGPIACHCRQGFLWLLQKGHLCFTEVWRAPSEHWRHRRSCSAGFNYFF